MNHQAPTQPGKTFHDLFHEAQSRTQEITVAQLKAWQAEKKPFVLLDVREEGEFGGGHIPGAIHLPRGFLELQIERALPQKDQPIVVYCAGGIRSVFAADTLQVMGYQDVHSLTGGWKAWAYA